MFRSSRLLLSIDAVQTVMARHVAGYTTSMPQAGHAGRPNVAAHGPAPGPPPKSRRIGANKLQVEGSPTPVSFTHDTRNKPPNPTGTFPTDPLTQLGRCDELRRRTSATNKASEKMAIMAEYPDLRELMEFIYQPKLRLGIRPANLHGYLTASASAPRAKAREAENESVPIPPTLLGLFKLLPTVSSSRDAAVRFVRRHGIWAGEGGRGAAPREGENGAETGAETPFETFCRLLQRNLNGGWSARTLKKVTWHAVDTETQDDTLSATADSSQRPTPALDTFQVALGRTILPPFTRLFKAKGATWYASRKLDGVRCIVFIDVRVSESGMELENIRFLSRLGNEFSSLNKLRAQLECIASLPMLREWLDRDPLVVDASAGDGQVTQRPGVLKRLVLDGEVCVLRQSDDGFIEDFTAAVSQVRRKDVDVAHPAYFLLDVIPWCEFSAASEIPTDQAMLKKTTFMERHQRSRTLSEFLGQQAGAGVKLVPQVRVDTLSAVEKMVGQAAEQGWEGLVFRADALYKGNRSSDVFKFKHWQDAEYTVQSLDTSIQRLSINGVYAEHDACSNVWIEHNGHPVSVGSGFTTAQRLQYAADPSTIVGKQITVEYFAESVASGREGVQSLRFPRVKQVWEEGTRSV